MLLTDPEWTSLPDREIARLCSVEHKTVSARRSKLEASGEIPQIDARTVTRNGTVYPMNTPNIGSKPIEVRPSSEPAAVVEARVEAPTRTYGGHDPPDVVTTGIL